ncbi:DUF1800 domain-containing protein [Candidatus Reidiella endopervernicosa]|uniref:DUF1800 domain-containing protein n=1 Tax=Candidatus Reidiella endopervernicosa TaxID=2738883 RepID=A0A6N0HS12_9GAMM|nr:DUF1800 domain-containing protein [Candidatus Reidiella endopervernicosa]QKQ25163.1 DUF1800 domain-containing protein [Candidatus Reidiella endopervernicosa]
MKLSPLLLLALLPALNGCFGEAPPGGSQNQTIATDSVSEAAAVRFLSQSSFGATEEAVDEVIDYGIEGWIDAQIAMTSPYSDTVTGAIATPNAITTKSHLERTIEIAQMVQQDHDWYDDPDIFNSDGHWLMEYYQLAAWWEHSLKGDDQLRQRVAYALSQIFVVSTAEMPLDDRAESLANYYDILAEHAFGNFRDLMGAVSRSATMGIYLSHQGNEKENPATQTRPDENFARELMQLFTIGLYELNVDGTPRLSSGNLIPTYSQEDIVELAKVMTGWDLQLNSYYGRNSANSGDYTLPMEFTDAYHEYSAKTVLGETIPANLSGSDDLDAALDIIFAHANVAPFISRQLIQRLVTSNPSSAYIGRVAAVFNDNGSGVKGDLGAVVKAILMDDEARSASYISQPSFGKPREPVLAFSAMLRLLDISPLDGWSGYDENGVQPNFGSRYFFGSMFWASSPSKRQILNATVYAYGAPTVLRSLRNHLFAALHNSLTDSTPT